MTKIKYLRDKCVYDNCVRLCFRVEIKGRVYLYPECITHYVGRERMLAYWRKCYHTNELFRKKDNARHYEKYHNDPKYKKHILELSALCREKRRAKMMAGLDQLLAEVKSA